MIAEYETVSGRRFDLIGITAADIDIEDIAHHLSMTCRFNGAIKTWYNNAQHSGLVGRLAGRLANRAEMSPLFCTVAELGGHVHDGGEAYTGDMTQPMKRALRHLSPTFFMDGIEFQCVFDYLEHTAIVAIEQTCELPEGCLSDAKHPVASLVKEADLLAFQIEETVLRRNTGETDLSHFLDEIWTQEEAKDRFLVRFSILVERYRALKGPA